MDVGDLPMKLTNAIQNAYLLDLKNDAKNKEYVSTVSSSSIAVAAPRPLRSATSAANQSQHDLRQIFKQRQWDCMITTKFCCEIGSYHGAPLFPL